MKADKKTKTTLLILIIAEMLLIIGAIPFLFTNRETYRIDASEFSGIGAFYNADSDSTIIDSGEEASVYSPLFELPRGAYRVKFRYNTDKDQRHTVKVEALTERYLPVKTNAVTLYNGIHETDYICYVTTKTKDIRLSVNYSGEGSIEILGADIIRTNIYTREFIFTIALLSILIDAIFILGIRGFWDKTNKVTAILLLGCVIIASAPLMTDYMVMGSDYLYHLLRIEGVKDGILAGYFPVRIYPNWVYGYGYIDAVMYGNFLLYIPAVFRLVGFSVTTSYKILIVFVNIMTVLVSYICFKKMFKDNNVGILAAFMYTLMPYRLENIYSRAMAGEFCAAIFIPIIILGLYRIFTDDTKEKDYKYNWVITTAGICGVLWNHVLSTEIVAFFVILTCLVLIKRTFTPKRFIQLLTTLVVSVLASLWFIIPFLDNYMHQDLQIKNVYARTIQERGIFPVQLLMLFIPHDSNLTLYGRNGLEGQLNQTVGLALIVGLFVFFIALAIKENKKDKYVSLGIFFAAYAVLTGFMSTLLFPWDYIQSLNGIVKTLVSSLQFPTRLLMIMSLVLVMVAACAYMLLKGIKNYSQIIMWILIGLTILGSVYYTGELLNKMSPYRLYDVSEFGTGYTASSEYIFNDIKSNYNEILTYRDGIPSENVVMTEYDKKGLEAKVRCENNSAENGFVDLPMLYYIGYKAEDIDTGETMTCVFGSRCDIRVVIPPGYSGKFEVKYTGRGYWRLGDLISAFTIAAAIAWVAINRKKV